MLKYTEASANTFSGVFIHARIGSLNRNPSVPRSTLSVRKLISVVEIAVFIFPSCFAPRNWDTTTELPMPPPMAMAIKTLVME